MSKCIWKTAHFGANCVEIGYLLLGILQFYVFKMAANGGRHFEINIKTENYKTQFISQKHANSCTFDIYDVNFMQLIILCGYFMNIVLVEGSIEKKKINILCELVMSQPLWFAGSQLDISKFSVVNNLIIRFA